MGIKKTTLHHIIPTSRGGIQERNSENTIKLPAGLHQHLHTAFGNAIPNEQIIEILGNPNTLIKLTKEDDLYGIINSTSYEDIYLPGIITDLSLFENKNLYIGQVKKPKNIKKFQDIFFKSKIGEKNILKILNISEKTLKKEFLKKIMDIIG